MTATPFHNGRPDHRQGIREAEQTERDFAEIDAYLQSKARQGYRKESKTMSTSIAYIENGVKSTLLNRILKSKTTYVVAAFVLAQAEVLFDGKGWLDVLAWRQTGIVALGGAALILIRAGMKKAELASNALNPAVPGVKAIEVEKKSRGALGTAGIMALLAGALGLAGCGTAPEPEVCFTDANGNRMCFPVVPPKQEPNPQPPAMPPPPPPLPLTVAPLEK